MTVSLLFPVESGGQRLAEQFAEHIAAGAFFLGGELVDLCEGVGAESDRDVVSGCGFGHDRSVAQCCTLSHKRVTVSHMTTTEYETTLEQFAANHPAYRDGNR